MLLFITPRASDVARGNALSNFFARYFEGMWEFPGGKIENGESREDALKREIKEELDVEVKIEKYLCTVDYDYPNFHLTMHCYHCCVSDGVIKLLEHLSAKWLTKDELKEVEWLPADVEVAKRLLSK